MLEGLFGRGINPQRVDPARAALHLELAEMNARLEVEKVSPQPNRRFAPVEPEVIRGKTRQHCPHAEGEPARGLHAANARIHHRVTGEPLLPSVETPASLGAFCEFLPQPIVSPHEIAELDARAAKVSKLRDRLISGVLAKVENVFVNGAKDHLPGIAHFTFEGAEGDALLLLLDAQGVQCSTGSACSAGVPRPSHVLLAMGMNDKRAKSSLRFSIGHSTTEEDIDLVISVIAPVVERARAAGLV